MQKETHSPQSPTHVASKTQISAEQRAMAQYLVGTLESLPDADVSFECECLEILGRIRV
ncbi:hypothetical protein NBRC116601_12690 [Cognatishimia sp. WU-CL00825]